MPLVTDLRLAALGQRTGGCGLLLQSGWEIGLRSRAVRTVGLWGVERKGGGGGGSGSSWGPGPSSVWLRDSLRTRPRGPRHGLLCRCSLWGPLISFALARPRSPAREREHRSSRVARGSARCLCQNRGCLSPGARVPSQPAPRARFLQTRCAWFRI